MIDPSMIIRDEGYSHGTRKRLRYLISYLRTVSIRKTVAASYISVLRFSTFDLRHDGGIVESSRGTELHDLPHDSLVRARDTIDRSPVERPSRSPARGIKAVEADEEEVWGPREVPPRVTSNNRVSSRRGRRGRRGGFLRFEISIRGSV